MRCNTDLSNLRYLFKREHQHFLFSLWCWVYLCGRQHVTEPPQWFVSLGWV